MSSEAFLPPFIQLQPGMMVSLTHSRYLSLRSSKVLSMPRYKQAVMEMHKILCWLGGMNLNLISSVDTDFG